MSKRFQGIVTIATFSFFTLMFLSFWNYGQVLAQDTQFSDHPPLTPMRDRIIDYDFKLYPTIADIRRGTRQTAMGPVRHVRIYYGGEGAFTKIVYLDVHDPKIALGAVIIDRMHDVVIVIMNGRHAYALVRNQEVSHQPFLLDLSMHYIFKNQNMNILGTTCQVWDVLAKQGTSQACVTDDGFVLKQDGIDMDGLNGSLLATHIEDTALHEQDFSVPKGFHEDVKHK